MIKNKTLYSVLAAGLLVCTSGLAVAATQSEPAEKKTAAPVVTGLQEREAASELADMLKGIDTLSANFEQHTLGEGGRRLQESRGNMVLKRPNLFRWNVLDPFPQEVVSDGNRVSYFDKDMEQVTLQDMDIRTNATPALLLSGDTVAMLKDFTVTLAKSGDNRFFTLLPKGSDSSFQELQLSFSGKTLKDMTLLDALGSRTRIVFSDVVVNAPVKDKTFELYIPPGVDVLDHTSAALQPSGKNASDKK